VGRDDQIRAALDVHQALNRLNETDAPSSDTYRHFSGEVVVSTISRADAQDYTVLGGSVNLAAQRCGYRSPMINKWAFRTCTGVGGQHDR
jgi:hypothetical protein